MADKDLEFIEGEIVSEEDIDIENSLIATTRGGTMNDPKILMAIEAIERGRIPPSAIKTRPGGGGDTVKYAAHTYATRTMNAAFRWLWDFECLEFYVDPHDGSVATRNQMTIHVPMKDGQFYTRRITEIGSFEAYPRKNNNGGAILNQDGSPAYTMSTADRIASSVSRGLVKCMLRAFNFSLELSEKETDNFVPTNKDAWNALLRFGKNQGLTRDQITEVLKGKVKSDELADRFGEAYKLVYNLAKGKTEEEAPEDLK